jgi:DNA-binding transcriptional ArsR family regulator
MARLLPFQSETATEEGQPRVVDLEGEDADAVFGALSSTTAREIYARLDDDPATPSDVADAIDSSIQNVRYHLENLEDAGLVEVVDTWYSSRGNEMSVYATTDGPLIVTSDESRATKLKEALSRLIGGVGVLAAGSLLVQYAVTRWLAPAGTGATANGGAQPAGSADGSDPDTRTTESEDGGDGVTVETADGDDAAGGGADGSDGVGIADVNGTEDAGADGGAGVTDGGNDTALNVTDGGNDTVQNATDGVEAAEAVFGTVPPGLLFFLGGLVVLLAVTVYWYRYRPAY